MYTINCFNAKEPRDLTAAKAAYADYQSVVCSRLDCQLCAFVLDTLELHYIHLLHVTLCVFDLLLPLECPKLVVPQFK